MSFSALLAARPAPVARTSLLSGLTGQERVYRAKGAGFGRPAVGHSEDLERILAIPRREMPDEATLEEMATFWTQRLERPGHEGCSCRIKRLRPLQAWYMEEASDGQGVLGHIEIGGGKTLVDVLLCMAVPGTKTAVVMIPASLRAQFYADFKEIGKHFVTPNLAGDHGPFYAERPVLHVLTYSQLQAARFATILQAKAPDLIILDEAQSLKDAKATRTGRFLRHMAANLHIKLFAHSGSLTTRSLLDYGHLSALALREGSPLPLDMGSLREWAGALDPGDFPGPVGALRKLCEPHETARAGFRRRLTQTPGVIVSEDARLPTRLVLRERKLEVPEVVRAHLAKIRSSATRPDGEELVEALEVNACLRQMACGMFLRWRFPRGEPVEVIDEWFKRRSAWHKALREELKNPRDHFDSPLLLALAAERSLEGARSKHDAPAWAEGAAYWKAWKAVMDTVEPVSDAVWVDDFMVKDAVKWGQENVGIVWFDHVAVGHAIAKACGFPYYGGGPQASAEILHEKGDRTIVASIHAHSQGKNLQAFNKALVTTWPASDGVCEQMIGRQHRSGQTAEVVTVDRYAHTQEEREALVTATEQAKYVQETTGAFHRLLFAERT